VLLDTAVQSTFIRGVSRSARFKRGTSVLALLGAWCFSAPAGALVIPVVTLYNTSVPANGVLRFTETDGLTVQIFAADGSEVPGNFIAPGVWRPDEPFTVGTYTADITWETKPDWVRDATFEVTPAVASADLISMAVTSRVDPDGERVLEQVCCQAGESQPPEGCDGACPPLCVPVLYETKHVVLVNYEVANAALDWQVQVAEVMTDVPGEFTLGYWEVEGSPAQLCGTAEVFSWLDDSTTIVKECIPNPQPMLAPRREPVTGFGNASDCTVPPLGYETLWCGEREYFCREWLLTPEAAGNQEAALACQRYDDVCQRTEEDVTSAAGSAPTGGVDDGATETPAPGETDDDTNEHSEPRLRSVDSADGCSIAGAASQPPNGRDWSGWALVMGIGVVFCRRLRG
jgi:hypothetical protein